MYSLDQSYMFAIGAHANIVYQLASDEKNKTVTWNYNSGTSVVANCLEDSFPRTRKVIDLSIYVYVNLLAET